MSVQSRECDWTLRSLNSEGACRLRPCQGVRAQRSRSLTMEPALAIDGGKHCLGLAPSSPLLFKGSTALLTRKPCSEERSNTSTALDVDVTPMPTAMQPSCLSRKRCPRAVERARNTGAKTARPHTLLCRSLQCKDHLTLLKCLISLSSRNARFCRSSSTVFKRSPLVRPC